MIDKRIEASFSMAPAAVFGENCQPEFEESSQVASHEPQGKYSKTLRHSVVETDQGPENVET